MREEPQPESGAGNHVKEPGVHRRLSLPRRLCCPRFRRSWHAQCRQLQKMFKNIFFQPIGPMRPNRARKRRHPLARQAHRPEATQSAHHEAELTRSSIGWLRSVATMRASAESRDAMARVSAPVPAAVSNTSRGLTAASRSARSLGNQKAIVDLRDRPGEESVSRRHGAAPPC